MAGGVSDGKKDRAIFRPGPVERLITPWVPVHRIVGVLAEVGGRFLSKAVHPVDATGRDGATIPGPTSSFRPKSSANGGIEASTQFHVVRPGPSGYWPRNRTLDIHDTVRGRVAGEKISLRHFARRVPG